MIIIIIIIITCARKLNLTMNQTRGTLLEKQGRAHKRCTPVDPHIWNVQKQDDQHELTYSNYVRTQDVTLKTCRRR